VTIALVDNGSLEPASQLNLRAVARGLAERTGRAVAAVSLKHSNRIPAANLGGTSAQTLAPWVRSQLALGEREFLIVPFFISPQGAIGSALRGELDALSRNSGGFTCVFSTGIADEGVLGGIVADRVRETLAKMEAEPLDRLGARPQPALIVVDHGGPSRASATLRDAVASEVRFLLGNEVGSLAAASLESPEGPEFSYNEPLFEAQLEAPGFDVGDVVVAPLFLSPGRHAGPEGDLARIAAAAASRKPGLRVHFTGLVGSHPTAVEALARGLMSALETAPATR
jgi:sirohydrochlorin ferrochelatase